MMCIHSSRASSTWWYTAVTTLALSMLLFMGGPRLDAQGDADEPEAAPAPAPAESDRPQTGTGPREAGDGPRPSGPPPRFRPDPPPLEAFPLDLPEMPAGINTPEELAALRGLLEMPPERRRLIAEVLGVIEAMTPAEREKVLAALDEHAQRIEQQREKLRRRLSEVPEIEQRLLRRYWMRLDPAEREAQRERLLNMTPEERQTFRREIVLRQMRELRPQGLGEGERPGPFRDRRAMRRGILPTQPDDPPPAE